MESEDAGIEVIIDIYISWSTLFISDMANTMVLLNLAYFVEKTGSRYLCLMYDKGQSGCLSDFEPTLNQL